MAYGLLINNDDGDSILDTRVDKQSTVIKSGSVNCPGTTTSIVSGTAYANAQANGNYTSFGAPDNNIDTVWAATSSGTLSSGRVSILQLITATGVTAASATANETGVIIYGGPGASIAKGYNCFQPNASSAIANNKIAIGCYYMTQFTIDYAAITY
jgi:hypothetical protein